MAARYATPGLILAAVISAPWFVAGGWNLYDRLSHYFKKGHHPW